MYKNLSFEISFNFSFNFRSKIMDYRSKRDRLLSNFFFQSFLSPLRVGIFHTICFSGSTTRSIDYDKAVHGYHLGHVVLAWCENDSDAR